MTDRTPDPDSTPRISDEYADAEVARWPGGWTDGTGVSYRDYESNADRELAAGLELED